MTQTKTESRVRSIIEKARQIKIASGESGELCHHKINGVAFYVPEGGIDEHIPFASIKYAGVEINLFGLIAVEYPGLAYFPIDLEAWFLTVERRTAGKSTLDESNIVSDFQLVVDVEEYPMPERIVETIIDPVHRTKADLLDQLMGSKSINFNK